VTDKSTPQRAEAVQDRHDAGDVWDRRFIEQSWPTEPDPFLVELARALPPGRSLDIGSGPGRNSLWLAAEGWTVTLVDASKVALDQARARAEGAGLQITTAHHDVFHWLPDHDSYELVIVANLHPGLESLTEVLASAADALVAGGHLYVVGHDITSLGRHGPPDPDRLLTVERLSHALPPAVSVEVLDRRASKPDHGLMPDAKENDTVVYAWAIKPAA
jgi:SAM-dependent methyltransferase